MAMNSFPKLGVSLDQHLIDVAFTTLQEARSVAYELNEYLIWHKKVTVANYYSTIGIIYKPEDNCRGWYNLFDLHINTAFDGTVRIKFPPIVDLRINQPEPATLTAYTTGREDLARIIACETRGVVGAEPYENDYKLAERFLVLINSNERYIYL